MFRINDMIQNDMCEGIATWQSGQWTLDTKRSRFAAERERIHREKPRHDTTRGGRAGRRPQTALISRGGMQGSTRVGSVKVCSDHAGGRGPCARHLERDGVREPHAQQCGDARLAQVERLATPQPLVLLAVRVEVERGLVPAGNAARRAAVGKGKGGGARGGA